MANILIFGGSGFIGTHLSKKLTSEGNRCIIVDLVKPRFFDDNITYIKGDVRDLSSLNISDRVDYIYNLAAIHTTPGHPSHEYYETNILGANSICEFAEVNNIKEIIFTSSISVYGPDENLKDETSELTPNSAYGYSKLIAENVHKTWLSRGNDRSLTIVRPAVVFGPGEGGNFTRLAKILNKGFFIYPGRKDTIKSCIYVEDLLFAIECARKTSNNYELFNGAYLERYTLEDIINAFRSDYFPKIKVFMIPKILVIIATKLLHTINFLNIGIHPDRVKKLIVSTNIYPSWIEKNNIQLPGNLHSALKRWSDSTNGAFN